MSEPSVLYALSGAVATVTRDRPERLNSFTDEMHGALRAALDRAEAEHARCLLLTGAGRGFCAGQDLADPLASPASGPPPTLSLVAIRRAVHASAVNTLDEQLDHERGVQQALGRSADYAEGVRALMDKRPPTFHGG